MTRRTRWGFAVGVCLIHGILLRSCEQPNRRNEPEPRQAPLSVRLLPAPTTTSTPTPAPTAEVVPVPQRSTPARPATPAPASEPVTQAISVPAIGSANPGELSGASAHRAASSPAPAAPPAPLNLRLPPPALRGAGPAMPRAEPRPSAVESRLSTDLADGPLHEEALGNGRLRLRQGRRCVELRDARMAQIDPFNQSVSPIPKQGEDCSR